MALTKVDYVDGVTTIMAKNLNDIQNEVIANGTAIATQATQISTKANATDLASETTAREAADTALGNELDDVKSAINGESGSVVEIQFTNGAYIVTGNVATVNLTPVADATSRYAIIDCSEGDVFSVSCKSYQVSRAWCFINASNAVVAVSAGGRTIISENITAPSGATKAIFNDDVNSSGGVSKIVAGTPGLVEDVTALKESVNELKQYETLAVKNNLVAFDAGLNNEPKNFSNVYRVGEGEEFETINSAVARWAIDNYPVAVFFIRNGIYKESVTVEGHDAAFIGESKDGTIIHTTSGNYVDPPFNIRHGNFTLKNMTLIADHSENPNFDYEEQPTLKAYGLHIDGGNIGGIVTIENCKILSYQAAAVGTGTIPNSKIQLVNCDCRSYTDFTDDTSSSQYSKLTQGCVLWHRSNPDIYPDRGSEEFGIVNCSLYAKNFYIVLKTNRSVNTEEMPICAINNTLVSGRNPFNQNPVSGPVTPTADSIGNNIAELNYNTDT